MARVLLVKPSGFGFHRDLIPPVGLLYLAAVLRQRGGHDVRILDTRLARDAEAALDRALLDFKPDLVGFSAISAERRSLARQAALVRTRMPSTPIIVGGPHPTALPRMTLRDAGADAVVVGEGEVVVVPLVEMLLQRQDPSALPGVVTAATSFVPGAVRFPPAPLPDLDALPLPAWDLIDLAEYHRRDSGSSLSPWRYAVMISSRGCPWTCSFCHNVHGKRFRPRSLASIAAEIQLLQGLLGNGAVEIMDDNFNLDLDRAKGVLELFCQTGGRLRPSFITGVRSDRVDEPFLDLMQRARTPFVTFAIESGNAAIQKQIGKNLNLDAARQAIFGAARRHLYTNAFFILGFPGETRDQMEDTLRFSHGVPLTQAHFFRLLAYPGSRIWDQVVAERPAVLERFDEGDFFVPSMNLSAVPDREYDRIYRMAWLSFYARPGQAVRLLRGYPNRLRLFKKLGTGARLLLGAGQRVPEVAGMGGMAAAGA